MNDPRIFETVFQLLDIEVNDWNITFLTVSKRDRDTEEDVFGDTK